MSSSSTVSRLLKTVFPISEQQPQGSDPSSHNPERPLRHTELMLFCPELSLRHAEARFLATEVRSHGAEPHSQVAERRCRGA